MSLYVMLYCIASYAKYTHVGIVGPHKENEGIPSEEKLCEAIRRYFDSLWIGWPILTTRKVLCNRIAIKHNTPPLSGRGKCQQRWRMDRTLRRTWIYVNKKMNEYDDERKKHVVFLLLFSSGFSLTLHFVWSIYIYVYMYIIYTIGWFETQL